MKKPDAGLVQGDRDNVMRVSVFRAKIHRATVTGADVNYEGSISVDAGLLEASGIFPYEAVHVLNISTGTRLVTYAIPAPPGSGTICLNGAAAHLNRPGELVIIIAYCDLSADAVKTHQPRVVHVDGQNRPTRVELKPALANA